MFFKRIVVWVFLEWKGGEAGLGWWSFWGGGGFGFGFHAATRLNSSKSDAGGNEYVPKKICVTVS